MQNIQDLQKEIDELKQHIEDLGDQSQKMYSQINRLLLWKCSLKVRINESCPFKDIVGREGFISDSFPDGFTVWNRQPDGTDDLWRLDADWLDIVEWNQKQFELIKK